jgi:integrase
MALPISAISSSREYDSLPNSTFLVTHGKTAAARRVLPMTPRVRMILESRWEDAGKPGEGWVWPAPTYSGHLESSSLKNQHARCFSTLAEEAKKNNGKPVRAFVLYSLRHTLLTRLGESGCDAWTLARIAGHSSVAMSTRYVHPSEDAVFTAVERLGGHKIGHSTEIAKPEGRATRQLPS